MNRFARRLRRLRLRRGWSLAELAAAAGLTKPYIWRLEQAQQDPRLAVLRKLARALDVTLDELAG